MDISRDGPRGPPSGLAPKPEGNTSPQDKKILLERPFELPLPHKERPSSGCSTLTAYPPGHTNFGNGSDHGNSSIEMRTQVAGVLVSIKKRFGELELWVETTFQLAKRRIEALQKEVLQKGSRLQEISRELGLLLQKVTDNEELIGAVKKGALDLLERLGSSLGTSKNKKQEEMLKWAEKIQGELENVPRPPPPSIQKMTPEWKDNWLNEKLRRGR